MKMVVAYLLSLALAGASLASESSAPTESAALSAEIAKADAAFFDLYFMRCAPDELRGWLTDDFEMYHDRGGQIAGGAASFVADYARDCAAPRTPESWHSRRELVPASLHVIAVPRYGAIEEGDHLFYERQGDGPERLAGRAHFVQLWKRTATGWQLARVFSYDHAPAQ